MIAQERLFGHFMDPVDGVLCLPAESDAAAVAKLAEPSGWRFPLWLDPVLPLREQVRCSSHVPASSRFGPYCDNITGMNWLLPDGRTVRVGERVVKSTTGYDLLRFLLESGERHGHPLDYVLRLRPLCESSQTWHFSGEPAALSRAVPAILHSSWIHWMESLEALVDDRPSLRATVHCPRGEVEAFEEFFAGCAKEHGLQLEASPVPVFPAVGLPDFVVKTTVDRVLPAAFDLGRKPGVRCVGLCPNGVVLGYVSDPAGILQLLQPMEKSLHAAGGDWRSRHVAARSPEPPESDWLTTLRKEWGIKP